MSFDGIKTLTTLEILAIAQIRFVDERFTANELAKYVSALFSSPFRIGFNSDISKLLKDYEKEHLVESVPGPRGGLGYKITDTGSAVVSQFDFPEALIERRQKLDAQKMSMARESAAPVILELLNKIPDDFRSYKAKRFLSGIWKQWLEQGWLSTSQVDSMADTALNLGVYIDRELYVGAATEDWRKPYIEEQRRKIAERKRLEQQRSLAIESKNREIAAAKAAVREKNLKIAADLRSGPLAEKLMQLQELVKIVFPETNLAKGALTAAYSGGGSKALRVCISALAYGVPPNQVWSRSTSQLQPDENSDVWRTLVTHDAYRAWSRKIR